MKFINQEMHANQGGVYRITNTITGDFYWGKAKWFQDRYEAHLYTINSTTTKYGNERMKASVQKYGIDAFEFRVIAVTPNEEIALLIEDQLLKPHLKGFYNIATTNSKVIPSVYCIPVSKYALDGSFIETYESLTEAAKSVGLRATSIQMAADGLTTTAKNYMWRKNLTNSTESIPSLPEGYSSATNKGDFWKNGDYVIKQWNYRGELLREYTSLETASKENNLNRFGIMNQLNGGIPTHGGFIFTLGEETPKIPDRVVNKPVSKYSLDREFICTYRNINEAAEDIGCKYITIFAAVNKSQGSNRSMGFLWEYEGEELQVTKTNTRTKKVYVLVKNSTIITELNSIKDLCENYGIARHIFSKANFTKSLLRRFGFEVEYE